MADIKLKAYTNTALPENGDIQVISGCNVGSFDIMAEKNECEKKVVNMRLVNW